MTTVSNIATTIVSAATVWTALGINAITAVTSLRLSYSWDRTGLIDRRAVRALPTLAIGLVLTGLVLILPRSAMPIHPTRVTDGITEAWVWAASIVSVVWLYAVAAALVTTVIYFRQQRRLHAAAY